MNSKMEAQTFSQSLSYTSGHKIYRKKAPKNGRQRRNKIYLYQKQNLDQQLYNPHLYPASTWNRLWLYVENNIDFCLDVSF
jgi:hypothetical protein